MLEKVIFLIFVSYPPPVGYFFLLSIGKFDQSLTPPIQNLITKSYIIKKGQHMGVKG